MNNKKKFTKSHIISALVLLSITAEISCTHSISPQPIVSFSKDIIPILNAGCLLNSGCHLGANSLNHEIDLDSAVAYTSLTSKGYITTKNPTASIFYVELTTGVMPKPPLAALPAGEQKLILLWIEQGAKDN